MIHSYANSLSLSLHTSLYPSHIKEDMSLEQQTFYRRDSASITLSFLILLHLSLLLWSFYDHLPSYNTRLVSLISILNSLCRIVFIGYYLWWLLKPKAIYSAFAWRFNLPWLIASIYKSIIFAHNFWTFAIQEVKERFIKMHAKYFVPACVTVTVVLMSVRLCTSLLIYYFIVTTYAKRKKKKIPRRLIEYLFVPFEKR